MAKDKIEQLQNEITRLEELLEHILKMCDKSAEEVQSGQFRPMPQLHAYQQGRADLGRAIRIRLKQPHPMSYFRLNVSNETLEQFNSHCTGKGE